MPLRNRQDSLFAKAFVSAPVSLTITSLRTGRLLEVNESFVRITGYSRDEAIGKSTIELGLWADRADREAELASIASEGSLRNREYRFRARDGREIIGLLSAERLDIDGEPCALTVIEDITERVTARQLAEATEAELRVLQQRLLTLATATASILASPQPAAVTSATIAVAREVFSADGYAIWRYDIVRGWRVVEAIGISDAFMARFIAMEGGRRVSGELAFSEPLVVEDVTTAPMLAELRDAYAAEGMTSMIVFPLAIRGQRSGTIVFYFRRRRTFDNADLQAGSALANIAAAALTTAELYAEQQAAREAADYARQPAAFLAEAGSALGSSLDYESTLRRSRGSRCRRSPTGAPSTSSTSAARCSGSPSRTSIPRRSSSRELAGAVPGGSERAGRRARGDPHRQAAHFVAHSAGAARGGGAGRRAPPDHPRARADLVHVRPADGARQDVRRDHVRQRGVGPRYTEDDLASRASWRPARRSRSRTRARTQRAARRAA